MTEDINTKLTDFAFKVLDSETLTIDQIEHRYRISPLSDMSSFVISISKSDFRYIIFFSDIDAFDHMGMSDNEIDEIEHYMCEIDGFEMSQELYDRIESAITLHDLK